MNKDILGSEKKFAEYVKRSDDAWEIVMKNRNSLTGAQRELADTYAKAGRSLVDAKTIEGVITHEMGHHVQWSVLDAKTNNLIDNRMKDYAPKISGYANASKGEYIAESFAAYMKGEKKLLDPAFADFLDMKRIGEREFSPRKSTKGSFGVNWEKVQSKEYRISLENLSENLKVVDSIEIRAKWALNNRNGLNTEELYAISLDTGEEIASILGQQIEFGVQRTEPFIRKLKEAEKNGEKILLLHNHPRGLPPSSGDLNALVGSKNISGITVGHDGSIYYYTRPNKAISSFDFDIAMRRYKMYTETTGMEKALEDLSEEYGFIFKKL